MSQAQDREDDEQGDLQVDQADGSTEQPGSDLGPQPDAEAVPPQLHAGGVDAVLDRETEPLVPDVSADANPATEGTPVANREGEDTSTKATREEEDAGDGNHPEESPA